MFINISQNYYINTEQIYSIEFTGKVLKINMINTKYYKIKCNTYFYKEKPKSIISDKHTRKYDLMANHEKKKLLKNVWGN